ncbi:hypothetical protein [Patulibacter sp.]|uniref:hypothetical protein n=1 Tax=Patulibacter sp. TaxID=1912859 RepID=UPI00272149AD|nr:hypothetical protein [Patulibacter sp.]MDO9407234.1 hypothetical protein [Patulibacter sp.]
MSPVPSRTLDRRRAAFAAAGTAAALALLGPAAASAAKPPVFSALQTVVQPGGGSTAAGNGVVAWAVADAVDDTDGHAFNVPTTIWTVRDGAPVAVAKLTDAGGYGADLEVGTAKGGVPVVVATTTAKDETTEVRRIVRLDTGEVERLPATRKGRVVGGVAVDNGRIYWGLHDRRTTTRTTSTLYEATLSGTTSGPLHRRHVTPKGVTIDGLVADRYRIAVETSRKLPTSADAALRLEIYFGVPQGRWNTTGRNDIDAGAFRPFDAVGFTQDRTRLITAQQEENGPVALYSTPIAGGTSTTIGRLGVDEQDEGLGVGQLEAGTGRLFTTGKGPDGAAAVGWSAPVVPVRSAPAG